MGRGGGVNPPFGQVSVVSGLVFNVNGKHDDGSVLCLNNVTGWDAMHRAIPVWQQCKKRSLWPQLQVSY